MRHHAFAAAMGLMTAAMLAPCSQSQAATADPTGYWYKPDAERESKIQVFKCGAGKSQLCAKIAWLKEPSDSKGQPLHDIRNEDPSMRGRPIVGLTIFTGLTPSAPATWTGKIYNPEDGHTYAATLTMVSRTEIRLRGCKAWLLCGEKQWLRTSAPPAAIPAQAPEGTEQIEASVKPDQAAVATAAASPAAPETPVAQAARSAPAVEAAAADEAPSASQTDHAIAPAPTVQAAVAPAEQSVPQPVALMSPAQPAAETPGPQKGYGYLNASMTSDTLTKYSGENVSSMFSMTRPLPAEAAAQQAAPAPATQSAAASPVPGASQSSAATAAADEAVPLPPQKPKAAPKPQTVAVHAAPKTNVAAATPGGQAAPAPEDGGMANAEADAPTQSAQADTDVEPVPMTRRQLRRLRRMQEQQQGQEPFLPWLR